MITSQELEQYRADTPATKQLIHFNNAGASLPPQVVVDTVIQYLQVEAAGGGYEVEAQYTEQLEKVYASIATLMVADPSEIAICENASAAWGMAFRGLDLQPGDEVITGDLEYVSNLINLIDAEKAGVIVTVIPQDADGNFPLDQLDAAISSRTKLVAMTHIPSSGGGMLPIEAIGAITKKHGVLYMVDACQSVGHYPVDVNRIQCDILSATGRKYLRAPRGTGFLYVRKSVQDQVQPLLMDQHATTAITLHDYTLRPDARRYELYEKSRALGLGLGAAAEYAMAVGVDRIWQRVQELAAYIREQLRTVEGVTVHDLGEKLCGIVTFSAAGIGSLSLKTQLIEAGINVSYGTAPATLRYMQRNGLTDLVRASIHYYNTEEEIDRFIEVLRTITYNYSVR